MISICGITWPTPRFGRQWLSETRTPVKMMISLIAALSRNKVIGRDNQLPWKLPADMQHFRRLTLGKPVLMGRRTFESIGGALPGRSNIVVSRNAAWEAPGSLTVHSLAEGIKQARGHRELMIIGGATIFAAALPLADRMYLTIIHQDISGDTRFVEFDAQDWDEIERSDHAPDEANPYPYSFITLQRKARLSKRGG